MNSLTMFKGLFLLVLVQLAKAEILTGEIYSFDLVGEGGKILSLTVDPVSKNTTLREINGESNGNQWYIPRTNDDNTFALFLEAQPFKWVDHIVESTKFVNIRQIPHALGAVGGSNNVMEQAYQGRNANAQKFYVVPVGDDPNVGVVTSLLLRQCLTGQGENEPVTLSPCNWSDPNQVFRVTSKTSGRYC